MAVDALRRIGDPAVGPLINALKDENSGVRETAAGALKDIREGLAENDLLRQKIDKALQDHP